MISSFTGVRLRGVCMLALAAAAAACSDVRIYPLHNVVDAGVEGQPPVPVTCPTSMVGWATWPGDSNPTTGGAGGNEVVASTPEDLAGYAVVDARLVIQVRGLLALTAPIEFTSNKTIYGDPKTPGSGVTGAGFDFTDASNIIVRNLVISKATAGEGDAITLLRSKHVWIDHCDLSSDQTTGNYDGLVDITHASDFITISWTRFHDHRETSLVGHSEDNMLEDADHLTVTYHHNLFARVFSGPRIRFGTAHVYNNQFEEMNAGGSFAVASESNARVRVEQNRFNVVAQPITSMYMDAIGGTAWDFDNFYIRSGANNIAPITIPIWVPPYAFELDSTESVAALVPQCSGVLNTIDPLVF